MYNEFHHLNALIKAISHNYVLIIIAAVLFFGVKAIIGLITYRKLKKELDVIKETVLELKMSNIKGTKM